MNVRVDDPLPVAKFGIGQPVPRNEDPVLVRGEGQYTDDIALPGQLYAAFVRSPYAHATLNGIDAEAARGVPGVLGVYTADDLAEAGYGALTSTLPLKGRDGTPMRRPERPILATGRVRFVGDIVAFVVAETPTAAQDAAEAVVLDVESLPAVTSGEEALAAGAPQLSDGVPENCALDLQTGDAVAVEAAFARAAHVTSLRVVNNRVVINPMEPRSAIGAFDADTGRYTLRLGSQGVINLRAQLAEVMHLPVEAVRVLTGQVGGSFGMKYVVFPEYVCVLHAAKALGRAVKWTDRRSESFVADSHGRDHVIEGSLALDAKGRFLAVKASVIGDVGAYFTQFSPMIAASMIGRHLASVYTTPLFATTVKVVFTNTSPIGAYRGAGRPEGNFIMERLIDAAAREMGLDRLALRRLNHIAPDTLPYTSPASGLAYDSGDFPGLMEAALEAADWTGFPARRAESEARGLRRGIGLGQYLEITAPPANEAGNIHFEDDGTVTIVTGTLDYGQGHWTPFAQVLVERLGVPFEAIRLVQGDSDRLQAGGGTGGSKSMMASGAAIVEAADLVIAKGRVAASHVLEAAVEDIAFAGGRFSIVGTDRAIDIMALARQLKTAGPLPPDVPETLDVDHTHKASPSSFPNGCHIAEVEIDPETGVTRVVRYTAANDFGVVVNPMLVEGQLHGGVVQGIGQALMERTVYDGDGQLLSGSFMDYAMPRADTAPWFTVIDRPTRATTNALGVKGCGEAGCAGSLPAVMNALCDALDRAHFDMPATPQTVWRALNGRP